MGWEIWSSGLEEWEPAVDPFHDGLTVLHFKNVGSKKFMICQDSLGRYWRREVANDSDG